MPPRISDRNMHHGTCVTHITSGFFWSRWRGKRSRHSRRMHNPKFNVSGTERPMSNWSTSIRWSYAIWGSAVDTPLVVMTSFSPTTLQLDSLTLKQLGIIFKMWFFKMFFAVNVIFWHETGPTQLLFCQHCGYCWPGVSFLLYVDKGWFIFICKLLELSLSPLS